MKKRTRKARSLGMESLETRVALASEVFVTIVLAPIHNDDYEVVAYRVVSIATRSTQQRKNTLQGEGEGADAGMREGSVNSSAIPVQQVKTELAAIGSTKPIAAIPLPGRVIDQPTEPGPSQKVNRDSPRARINESPSPSTSLGTAAWVSAVSNTSTLTQTLIHSALTITPIAFAPHLQTAPRAMSTSTLPSEIAIRKQSDLASLTDAVRLRNSEPQHGLGLASPQPINGKNLMMGAIAKPTHLTMDIGHGLEVGGIGGFSKYDSAIQASGVEDPSGWDQLPTMIGVARSLDGIPDNAFGPGSQIARDALLAVVSEFELGSDRGEETWKETDHRGMNTAGSILVAAYAASVARRKRKLYPKQE